MDLQQALKYWPFDGDFGMPGDRKLRDGIVTFRCSHHCIHCLGKIEPGTKGRSLTMLWDDGQGPSTGRYCTECTEAMAKVFKDDGAALDARFRAARPARRVNGQ